MEGAEDQGHINQTLRAIQGYATKLNTADVPGHGVLKIAQTLQLHLASSTGLNNLQLVSSIEKGIHGLHSFL